MIKVHVSEEDFDTGAEIAALANYGGGAIANFIGLVRGDGDVTGLELEHYPAMTDKALHAIADTAADRWPLHGITIIHRVGKLVLGDQIVLVCTASDHRQAALGACSYIMDRLKTDAPFWKKEWRDDGSSDWVEERQIDLDAAEKWQNS
ncbi:molybdenum cofactor biosynthesis protein MoaE [Parasphingorhabdus halotolerans]|uniref:Molybdopterin synthase catalytic subunit n=1 Tax=Parasphingorhabdus halotolerans TaxID=2725558 RepID=A0A6H2DJI4_9SPHN|nr:molybdenum cofactor biosynthesis protein MoaE [Parasphingorhabdus halotolerans]QJB68494.1 molybdenum cofactor biosynthesis protein MoaE [Parasphingorhabdus halotolerans]